MMLSYKLAYGSSWYLLPISVVELMDPLHILQSACINCPFTETLKQFHFCKFWLFLLLLYLWPPGSTNIFPTKTSSKKVIGPQDSDFIPSRQILVLLVSRNKAFTLPYRMSYYPLLATYQLINYHPQWVGWPCWGGAQAVCKNTTWISYTSTTAESGPMGKFTFSAGNKWPFFLFTTVFAILTDIK